MHIIKCINCSCIQKFTVAILRDEYWNIPNFRGVMHFSEQTQLSQVNAN